jgi:hypothetical protein
MMRHPDAGLMIGYAEGRLSSEFNELLQQHIETCAECRDEFSHWVSLLQGLKRTHLRSAPTEAISVSEAIYRAQTPGARKESHAMLVFDRSVETAVAGVRGATSSQQILMATDEFDVHLRVVGLPRSIVGQILAKNDADAFVSGAHVGISREQRLLGSAITDAYGEFRIGCTPAGKLRFHADVAARRILGDFTVKETNYE